MIRPLEYCENTTHLTSSIETIDTRILELLHLRKQYMAEKQKRGNTNDTEFVDLIATNKEIQQLVETSQLLQDEQR
ncbi:MULTISPECIES: hypothetical protein [Sphingobacterium]|uniref:hypothetical protein n=1 Tax=Sphingobacterium TaxID=28453 RepID=UPI0013DD08D1|nr:MULTISPECIES: hypothetical protein [unclassified Sphingobacterium]